MTNPCARLRIAILFALLLPMRAFAADAPVDNPVAAYYTGAEGYPAWTDLIHWDRAIDMSRYPNGKNDFDKFELARDELAAKGGGVLYYPAGNYDFSDMPADGLSGRGLMLKSGVVIRGQAPGGRPNAAHDGSLDLSTHFNFAFQTKAGGKVPRDWNIIGLSSDAPGGVGHVNAVGICWVHLTGAAIYFGPQFEWTGATWGTARSWRSAYVKPAWATRKPDGSHPGDVFMAGPMALTANNGRDPDGTPYPNPRPTAGWGRLVFGCVMQDSCVLNDFDCEGRIESPAGFGNEGFHTSRYNARIGIYGSRVLVANNFLPPSDKNFIYDQTTIQTTGNGNNYEFGPTRVSPVMFDYGRTIGIDVNKDLYALIQSYLLERQRGTGYYSEGVAVLDNYVFNHGHKGFNLSANWGVVRNNRDKRTYLAGGKSVYGLTAPWRLTLDGFVESSGGGGGMVSDNYSRAFDMAGRNLWIDSNQYDNLGSRPGNDGEGILCQPHNGTHWYSWAVTHNHHDKGDGQNGYIASWDSETAGMLIAWNKTAGWVGLLGGQNVDIAVVDNQAGEGARLPNRGTNPVTQSSGDPAAPKNVIAEVYRDGRMSDAVKITWEDASNNEIGFRVDRRIDGGKWTPIAYRPPHVEGSPMNPQAWVDFLSPPGKKLEYRVAAINASDDDKGASSATAVVTLSPTEPTPAPAARPGKTTPRPQHKWEDPTSRPVRN